MNRQQWIILLAAMLVTLVTGSIHCFSVFLVPLESLLGLPRAQISLFYSLALIFLTLSVLFGYLVYERVKPATMIFLSCTTAGAGLALSAFSTTWWTVFFGYSFLFGVANGFAYGYTLQLMGRSLPDFKGFAMAAVTAAYAVGSVVFSFMLAKIVQSASLTTALLVMGMVVFVSGIVSALMLKASGARYDTVSSVNDQTKNTPPSVFLICLFWVAYGCSVFAGLMAIGHAAGIIQSLGGEYSLAIWGAVFIGIGSSIGGFFIGAVIKPHNMDQWLLGLPLVSAAFLGVLYITYSPIIAIGLLSFIGFSYGAVIAVYPFVISEYFGAVEGPKVYARVFTAWGFAGLAGPWSAGKLFDLTGLYSATLLIACAIAILSTLTYRYTRKKRVVQYIET